MLLLFRRTATLGALFAVAVLVNVVALNFCYDVPVKLYPSTLLLQSLFLLLPDVRPLWGVLVLHQAAVLRTPAVPKSDRRKLRVGGHILQGLLVASLLFNAVTQNYHAWCVRDTAAATLSRPSGDAQSLDGTWIVDASSGWVSGKEWVQVTVGTIRYRSNDFIRVTERNGSVWNVLVSTDAYQTMHFLSKQDTELHWTVSPKGVAVLQGRWLNQPATLTMHAAAASSYPLLTRGFHWVQEYPFSR